MPQTLSDNVEVLIATDDSVMLQTLHKWLRHTRYDVVCVGDTEAAITKIKDRCPPLVLIDEENTRINSIEFCRWLRSKNLPHRVYVILITANVLTRNLIESAESGVDDFVRKPIAEGDLFARLRSGTRLLELERELSQLARVDGLTGLANRRAFYEQLRREWARVDRQHFPLSCVMLDLDFFKRSNDVHGHLAGDEVLRQVAARLLENSRTSDLVGRFGGDEFCVLLPETNEQGGAVWAERIRSHLADVLLADHADGAQLTASFGVAQRSQATKTPEQLIDLADRSLLEAKHRGRNRVVCYHTMQTNEAE